MRTYDRNGKHIYCCFCKRNVSIEKKSQYGGNIFFKTLATVKDFG